MKDGEEGVEDIDDEWKKQCALENCYPLSQDCPLTAGEPLSVCLFTRVREGSHVNCACTRVQCCQAKTRKQNQKGKREHPGAVQGVRKCHF